MIFENHLERQEVVETHHGHIDTGSSGAREDSWESLRLAKRSNRSILKKINPEYSLEGLILKLKLQYFGHLMQRTDWLENPDAGKDLGQEKQGAIEDKMVG